MPIFTHRKLWKHSCEMLSSYKTGMHCVWNFMIKQSQLEAYLGQFRFFFVWIIWCQFLLHRRQFLLHLPQSTHQQVISFQETQHHYWNSEKRMIFTTFDHFWNVFDHFGQFHTFWTILDSFWRFWTVLHSSTRFWIPNLDSFKQFWTVIDNFKQF